LFYSKFHFTNINEILTFLLFGFCIYSQLLLPLHFDFAHIYLTHDFLASTIVPM